MLEQSTRATSDTTAVILHFPECNESYQGSLCELVALKKSENMKQNKRFLRAKKKKESCIASSKIILCFSCNAFWDFESSNSAKHFYSFFYTGFPKQLYSQLKKVKKTTSLGSGNIVDQNKYVTSSVCSLHTYVHTLANKKLSVAVCFHTGHKQLSPGFFT